MSPFGSRGAPTPPTLRAMVRYLQLKFPSGGKRSCALLIRWLGRCRSLCIYGRTKTGKSTWARSLGSHVYCIGLVSGAEQMKAPSAEYAVFDDLRGGIKFFPAYKEWLGCQEYVTVKCLYKEPTLVKWGKPSIWLSNTDPRDEMNGPDVEWLEGNVDFVELNTKLFTE